MSRIFTKKQYIRIAEIIKANNAQANELTVILIKAFIGDSDKFDIIKFNKAINK
jgi:hypothetical protein